MVAGAATALPAQEPAPQEAAQATAPDTTEVRALNFLFEPRSQAPDDELLEVARAAGVDMFVDSTELTEQASAIRPRVEGRSKWYLQNLLTDLGRSRRLAWEIFEGERVVLLGPEPDFHALRPEIEARGGVRVVRPKMEREKFHARLAEYLKDEDEWTERTVGRTARRLISELPEDLRAEMLALIQPQAHDAMAAPWRTQLQGYDWGQSRLMIRGGRENDTARSDLVLFMPLPNGHITHLLRPWPTLLPPGARLGGTP